MLDARGFDRDPEETFDSRTSSRSSARQATESRAARRNALRLRHSRLNGFILDERMRPLPDHLRLTALKLERLRVKEMLGRLGEPV